MMPYHTHPWGRVRRWNCCVNTGTQRFSMRLDSGSFPSGFLAAQLAALILFRLVWAMTRMTES